MMLLIIKIGKITLVGIISFIDILQRFTLVSPVYQFRIDIRQINRFIFLPN